MIAVLRIKAYYDEMKDSKKIESVLGVEGNSTGYHFLDSWTWLAIPVWFFSGRFDRLKKGSSQ